MVSFCKIDCRRPSLTVRKTAVEEQFNRPVCCLLKPMVLDISSSVEDMAAVADLRTESMAAALVGRRATAGDLVCGAASVTGPVSTIRRGRGR